MTSLYLDGHDCFIHYTVMPGDGPVHVYLPALVSPSAGTLLQVAIHPALRGRSAILVDVLGCGLSDRPPEFSHTMRDHAATIAAVLDHERVQQAVVVGHSMGGTVGLWLALDRPDLVGRLVLCESNLTPGGGDGTRRIAAYTEEEWIHAAAPAELEVLRAAAVGGDTAAADYYAIRRWASDPRAVHAASVDLVRLDPDLQGRLFDLAIPRAFIYGDRPLRAARGRWAPDVPDPASLEHHGIATFVVADAGHYMYADNLDGFVDALIAATA